MKIHAQKEPHHFFLNFLTQRKLGILILVVFCSVVIFLAGSYAHSRNFYTLIARPVLAENVRIPINYIQGLFSNPPHLSISIKNNDFQKLAYKRAKALELGILIVEDGDEVSADIIYEGLSQTANVRLKGDWTDHLYGRKWSLRVNLKEDTLFGMKRFALNNPKTRNFFYEWVYHQALRREDILGLRYTFVTVDINGRNLGIYALEEHFSKELIESQKRREGPIIKLNEDLLWADRAAGNLNDGRENLTGLEESEASLIDSFMISKTLTDPTLSREFSLARDMLDSYRRGARALDEVFDVNRLARFFALSQVLGAEHATMWQNLRFYYNPITSLLEPIGFDGNAGANIVSVNMPELFPEIEFQEAYLSNLEEYTNPAYLDKLFADIGPELSNELHRLYRSYPYTHFSKEVFYENQRVLRAALNPISGIRVHLANRGSAEVQLDIATLQYLPVRIVGLKIGDDLLKPYRGEMVVPGRKSGELPNFERMYFSLLPIMYGDEKILENAHLLYSILGTTTIKEVEILPWVGVSDPGRSNPTVRAATIWTFPFLNIDNALKEVTVPAGVWVIDRDLIIPSGYTFIMTAGAQIYLTQKAMILSYGPVRFIGTEVAPVAIRSSKNDGQGIVVMKAGKDSLVRHTYFEGLAPPMRGGWELTGGITFYESPVAIEQSYFSNNSAGDDMINIVRSKFSITNSTFTQSLSDAFDGDFVTGTITDSHFLNVGGDAIDISGSSVFVSGAQIKGAGDKGISVGEESILEVRDSVISQAPIGIASKDKSNVTANKITINDTKTGLAAYQKKPEYGPASLIIVDYDTKNVSVKASAETGSTVEINGKKVSEEDNLYEKLDGGL